YNWYLTGEMLDTAIARELNARGIVSEYGQGRPWTPPIIHNILTCEKYIGTAVYNRTTQRMQTTAVPNPQNVWIRKRNAFPSLIELSIFERVQEIRRNRVRRIPSSDLLEMLRMVFREKGALSTDIINQDPRLPHVVTFANRFQTLSRAYELAGVRPNPRGIRHVATYRRTEQVRSDVFLEVCECIVGCGGTISPGNQRHTLVLNGRYVVSIRVSRAQHYQNKTYYRWEFPLQLPPDTDFVIAVQLEPSDTDYKAVYLFPVAAMGCSNVLMREEHPNDYAEYRHDSISALFGI
ncbi:recombinase family protein, partial [bacterium]|nr:recombinase family protein [bacterium]